MELNGERIIPASVDATWAALNDPEILKACIAGCETLERVGDDGFVAVVAMKIGPVSARFKGNLKLTNVNPPTSYTINFDGQGGVAGFGKGSADVSLMPISASATKLAYSARATVGGKMAQIGSRLIDATAGKITDDFFKAFEAQLQAHPGAFPAATRYNYAAQLGFQLHDADVGAFNHTPSQNDYWWNRSAHIGRDAIIVADSAAFSTIEEARDQFASLEKLQDVPVTDNLGNVVWSFEIWLGRDYRPH